MGTVEKNKKLAFVAADIHDDYYSGFSSLLKQSVAKGLRELIVPQEVLYEMHQETFLEGVKSMLSSASQSIKVTSEDPGAIDLLLKELGSDSKWNKFFIKDADTSCHSTTRKQFLSNCYDKLKAEIQNNHDDGKPFEVSGNNIATDKVNDICSCMNQKDRHGHLTLKFDADTCADAVRHILEKGVQRSWILKCKAPVNLAAMVDNMTNGWALDCSPDSTKETTVVFFPKDDREGLYEQMLKIFKRIFSESDEDTYLVPERYWRLGIKPILEAADDPSYKISHLDFVGDPNKKLLDLLRNELKEFCETAQDGRPGAWDIRVFGSYRAIDKLNWYETDLTKDCTEDGRKRILQLNKKQNEIDKYNKDENPYCAEITMPSAETFFSSKIVGEKKQDEAIGRSDSSLDKLSIGNALRYLNLPASGYCKLFILDQQPTEKGELVNAVKQVLTNPTGRTGWIAVFKNPVVKETDTQKLVALNGAEGVKRYVIPCGDRCLLFVNETMYELWKGKLQQAVELTVTKDLTEQTDGFLPILFAASTPSSKTTKLIIPGDVDPFEGGSDWRLSHNPFCYLIDFGGGRTGWDIVFEGRTKDPYDGNYYSKYARIGKVCGVALYDEEEFRQKGKSCMRFLPREEADERIFDKSKFKGNLSEESEYREKVKFESNWWKDCTRVPLDRVLKWVEKNAKCDCTVKIEVEDAELFLKDFEKFLSKAGKSAYKWELRIDVTDEKCNGKTFIESVQKLNKPAFRYGVEIEKRKEDGKEFIFVTVKQKEWHDRVEDSGTLTLTKEDVTKRNLFGILSDVLAINRDKKSTVKIKNLSLPFKPTLYAKPSLGADEDPTFQLRDALAILLGREDFGFESLTLTSAEGLDPNAFEKALNETLKARNINRLISVSPEGVITFKKHNMPMPAFESQDQAITTSFDNKNKGVEQSMLTLKWTDEWTKWFEDPTTDFGTFIEALAEHPEIRCVDFSLMPKDGVGHKKYLTENAVNKLLKVNGVYFVCRYMPDNTAGSLKDWGKWGQSYGLSFVKKASGLIATWRSYGKKITV